MFIPSNSKRILTGVGALLVAVGAARAASPQVETILPRGAQRGTEVDVAFKGKRLADAKEVLFYDQDLSAEKLEPGDAAVKVHLKVSPNARLGEHFMRLRTASGISELRSFYVGPFPTVEETAEPVGTARSRDPKAPPIPQEKKPSTFEHPQKINLNVTVAGLTEFEQVDFYEVECKKGQRLTAEVEAMRLGSTGQGQQATLDPQITIYDTSHTVLAEADDTALLRQDCFASCVIPRDGSYIIAVRDSAYGGGPNGHYRMHVGTFPRPRAVYPCGGKAGDEIDVKYIGDVLGDITKKVKIPSDKAGEELELFAEHDGLVAPSPNYFRVSSFPNVLEVEPNDDPQHANGAAGSAAADVPVAFNGIIEKDDDVDFFKFKATKGASLDVTVWARRQRSPLDAVLTIYNEKGNQIAQNDDSGNPDSYLRFNVPADGEYILSIHDQLKRGGPDYVYRIEVTPVEPKLTLAIPNAGQAGQPSQERQTIVVPRGNRFGTLIRATRADASGEYVLDAKDLPAGVKMIAPPLVSGQDSIPVIFEASADAPVAGRFTDLRAKPADDKAKGEGHFAQIVELAIGNNNNYYHAATVDKLAVAVADEVPFTIKIVQPKAPLAQNGSMDLKIVAERKGDFKGPINLKMLFDPPGVSTGSVTIPADKTEITAPVSATGGASAKTWKVAMLGEADVNGKAWICTPPADLVVVPPFLTAKIKRTAIEQGQGETVHVDLEQKTPFDGKAKAELLGLPTGVTAAPVEISSSDKEINFKVQTETKSPAQTHNTLFLRVTVMKDGEPVVQNLAQGGVLRIDAPRSAGSGKTSPAKK